MDLSKFWVEQLGKRDEGFPRATLTIVGGHRLKSAPWKKGLMLLMIYVRARSAAKKRIKTLNNSPEGVHNAAGYRCRRETAKMLEQVKRAVKRKKFTMPWAQQVQRKKTSPRRKGISMQFVPYTTKRHGLNEKRTRNVFTVREAGIRSA